MASLLLTERTVRLLQSASHRLRCLVSVDGSRGNAILAALMTSDTRDRSDFDNFFHVATGHLPFPYQKWLAGDEAPGSDGSSDSAQRIEHDEAQALPELLQDPTGTGKTAAAVLGWVWRRRKYPKETPRRLIYC